MRGTTIARVAEEAGVGVGTVSRVLNGSPAVSAATRRRVLEAIAALDYQPSPAARALSTGRSNAIGVVAPFFTQPSVIERLRGVSQTLANDGYQLILHDVERPDRRRAAAGVDPALPARPRGSARGCGGDVGAGTASDGRLRGLRRPGDRGAGGGPGGRGAGARGALGHRLRQRGGRGLHRADHGRAAAGGDRPTWRRPAAARGVRRGGTQPPDATRDRRADLYGSGEGSKVSSEGYRANPQTVPG